MRFLSTAEAAELAGVTPSAIIQARNAGTLKPAAQIAPRTRQKPAGGAGMEARRDREAPPKNKVMHLTYFRVIFGCLFTIVFYRM